MPAKASLTHTSGIKDSAVNKLLTKLCCDASAKSLRGTSVTSDYEDCGTMAIITDGAITMGILKPSSLLRNG
ncbi:hypothetical protein HNQ75_004132 [Rhizobium flavum]|uniref:Uncharacterized protein n=1 Tax=Pseudorhizobium flavum TaxID=1335061 RepID=A0A7W9Z163_9HYPH|nr:hypothetical protein [Pseudorhizobium flavum]CAD6631975.1 hypothetical protein RFYW14_04570 [Pseudorhizobium flavum]